MENYVFHHPCNGCLTKALCRERCQDFKDHTELAEMSIFGLWLIIFSGMLITLFWYLDEWIPNLYANITIVGCILFMYSHMIYEIIKSTDDFTKMKWWERLIILVIYPTGLPAARIWEYVDMRTGWLDTFKYRHNKKLRI